jgi:hypothetical protein
MCQKELEMVNFFEAFFCVRSLVGPHAGHRPNCKLILSHYKFRLELS